MDGGEIIGDELHTAAIAIGAEIGKLLAEIEKQRLETGDCRAVAAGIDDEIAPLGLGAGSAERTVERDVPGGFKR